MVRKSIAKVVIPNSRTSRHATVRLVTSQQVICAVCIRVGPTAIAKRELFNMFSKTGPSSETSNHPMYYLCVCYLLCSSSNSNSNRVESSYIRIAYRSEGGSSRDAWQLAVQQSRPFFIFILKTKSLLSPLPSSSCVTAYCFMGFANVFSLWATVAHPGTVNKLYILSPLLTHFDAIHCPIADGFLLYNHSKEIIIKKGQYAISLYVRLTLFFLEALGSIERRFLYFFFASIWCRISAAAI